MKLGVLCSHPIQYQAPLWRELARRVELEVFFAHRQSAQQQSAAGFGVAFDWDLDLLDGYPHCFLRNRARQPGVDRFGGCDTPEIKQRIREGGFDAFLVTGWRLKSDWQAVMACRRYGVPVLVRGDSQLQTPRSALKRLIKDLIYPRLLACFDAGLYVGQRNREYLLHYRMPEQRLFFAPHCIDTARFSALATGSDRLAMRAAWGLQPGQQAVLYSGKLIGLKRVADLIAAVAQLRARGRDLITVIAGDGELRQSLEALSVQLGVPARFLGFCNQTELPGIYAAADTLVLPSESETWGLVVNEALACGTPCAVSDACGCAPDLIVPGVTGSRFEPGNVAALAEAIAASLDIPHSAPKLLAHSEKYSVSAAASGIQAACAWLKSTKP
jgi:glycosyltransferase involved in cell wall biosynthesis